MHTCPLGAGNPSLRMSIGYNAKGAFRIAVTSTYGHWLPPNDHEVESGKFIGGTQKNLETWMRAQVPERAIVRAQRTYLDHETIVTF